MEKTQSKKKSFFYGWVIVAACMLIQAVPFSIAANLQPTFTNYVMSAEGFTLAQFSLIFTIGTLDCRGVNARWRVCRFLISRR